MLMALTKRYLIGADLSLFSVLIRNARNVKKSIFHSGLFVFIMTGLKFQFLVVKHGNVILLDHSFSTFAKFSEKLTFLTP